MSRSLKDDHYAVQRAAMDSLLADREKGVHVLIEHIKRIESKINPLSRSELQRLGLGP